MEPKNDGNIKPIIGRKTLVVVLILTAVIIGTVAAFLRFYTYHVDRAIYTERQRQMSAVTKDLCSGLDYAAGEKWNLVGVQSRLLGERRPNTPEAIGAFILGEEKLNELSGNDGFIAVDSDGGYYTHDGYAGRLNTDALSSAPEEVSFAWSPENGGACLLFLSRLDGSLAVSGRGDDTHLTYYGIYTSAAALSQPLAPAAYGEGNSVYIIGEDGSRVYHIGECDPLKSTDLYDALSELDYIHGNSFSQVMNDLASDGIAYSDAVMGGEEYCYTLYRTDGALWSVLFMLSSSTIAADVSALIHTPIILALVLAGIISASCALGIIHLIKYKNRQLLSVEYQNNRALAEVSRELSEAIGRAEQATEEARAANRAKSSFLANISHDIRTPMNVIVGLTRLMENEKDLTDSMRDCLGKIRSASTHLLALINDVLDMSKIESGGVTLSRAPLNFANQAEQVDAIIRPQIAARGQRFIVRTHGILHEYYIGDGVRLRQILINLLSNATKYTPDGGEITLDITELGSDMPGYARLEFVVADNGRGMPEDFIPHIFEPFSRSEDVIAESVQGTGLGLAIAKNIIDMMNGSITVSSKPGEGSRFDVILNVPIDREGARAPSFKSLLLVSADEELSRDTSAALSGYGVEFTAAGSVEDAAEKLAQLRPEAVLLDAREACDDTEHCVRGLRDKAEPGTVIIVLISCDSDMPKGIHGYGADGVLRAPLFLSRLSDAVSHAREKDAGEEIKSPLAGMRFLCAEDNELNAEILTELLHIYSAECRVFGNGRELVDFFRGVKPGEYDAILMDVQMPVMGGLEATKAIRNGDNPLGKTIPIIAMTVNAFSEDAQRCFDAGMDAHVSKPLDISMLERSIQNLMVPDIANGGGRPPAGTPRVARRALPLPGGNSDKTLREDLQ